VAFAATAAALKCLAGPGALGAPRRLAVERALAKGVVSRQARAPRAVIAA
jgi:hypothetical protein